MGALSEIQAELKAPKNQHNKFGNYNYRSAEDILEAVKPLLKKNNATLTISDEIVLVGTRFYVRATCRFTEGEKSVEVSAMAREPETKKGMDESQITGTASSYARKYALNGLFLIDDTKDADTDEHHQQTRATPPPPQNQPQVQQAQPSTNEQRMEIIRLVSETHSDMNRLLACYRVQSLEQMNTAAANHCINTLRGKLGA